MSTFDSNKMSFNSKKVPTYVGFHPASDAPNLKISSDSLLPTEEAHQELQRLDDESSVRQELKDAVSRAVGDHPLLPDFRQTARDHQIELKPEMQSELNLQKALESLPRPFACMGTFGLLMMLSTIIGMSDLLSSSLAWKSPHLVSVLFGSCFIFP